MDFEEIARLFAQEMKNEIYHSSADEVTKDPLVTSVDRVVESVRKTFLSRKK